MEREDAFALWVDVVTDGKKIRPTEAALDELCAYSNRTREEIMHIATHSTEISHQLWQEKDRQSDSARNEFFKGAWNWVFGTLCYHAKQAEGGGAFPLPADAARRFGATPGEMLDFGCGVATGGLLFARLGWRVTNADISPPLLEFARWRYARRRVDARFIELGAQPLESGKYDLITAFNTFAHIAEIEPTLVDLHRALKVGGHLVFDIDARQKAPGNEWFFYSEPEQLIQKMRGHGFAREPNIEGLFVYRKVDRAFSRNLLLFDRVYYSQPAALAKHALRRTLEAGSRQGLSRQITRIILAAAAVLLAVTATLVIE